MITIEPPSRPLTQLSSLSPAGLTRFVNRARKLLALAGQVDVLLASDRELQRLNRTFRHKNQPTDVLSFPAAPEIAPRHAGDLAISLDTAARQAADYGHSLRDEVRILLLHGLLHLAGHDHEADSGQMAALETRLRRDLRLPASLIERATQSQTKRPR